MHCVQVSYLVLGVCKRIQWISSSGEKKTKRFSALRERRWNKQVFSTKRQRHWFSALSKKKKILCFSLSGRDAPVFSLDIQKYQHSGTQTESEKNKKIPQFLGQRSPTPERTQQFSALTRRRYSSSKHYTCCDSVDVWSAEAYDKGQWTRRIRIYVVPSLALHAFLTAWKQIFPLLMCWHFR